MNEGGSTIPLTARENEIARLVAAGRSRKAIADELGISIHTVDAHLRQLSMKVPGDGQRLMRITRFVLVPASTRAN